MNRRERRAAKRALGGRDDAETPNANNMGNMTNLIQGLSNAFKGQMPTDESGNVKIPPWWQVYTPSPTVEFNFEDLINFAKSGLYTQCLSGGDAVLEYSYEGSVEDSKLLDLEKFQEHLEGIGAKLVYRKIDDSISFNFSTNNHAFFAFESGAVSVESNVNVLKIIIVTRDKDKYEDLQDLLGRISEYDEELFK